MNSNSGLSRNPRRRIFEAAVGELAKEFSFKSIDQSALETLTELLQCFYMELGRSCRVFAEHAGRTIPVAADLSVALVEMGISVNNIETYIRYGSHVVIPPVQFVQNPRHPVLLTVGQKLPLPSFASSSLPPFPDPYCYIRTPTHKQPVTEYEAIREKAANHKRDTERAITKFIAKTGKTHNLFENSDINMFPLIACKKQPLPYLSALLPQDQVFEPEELEYDPMSEVPAPKPRKVKAEPVEVTLNDEENTSEMDSSYEINNS